MGLFASRHTVVAKRKKFSQGRHSKGQKVGREGIAGLFNWLFSQLSNCMRDSAAAAKKLFYLSHLPGF